jgi:hypothetical protein
VDIYAKGYLAAHQVAEAVDAVVANLTLGVQYTFILRLQANAAGHQTIATGGAQLEVEELIE